MFGPLFTYIFKNKKNHTYSIYNTIAENRCRGYSTGTESIRIRLTWGYVNISRVGIGVRWLTRVISSVDLYRLRDCQPTVRFVIYLFGVNCQTIDFQSVFVERTGRYHFTVEIPRDVLRRHRALKHG